MLALADWETVFVSSIAGYGAGVNGARKSNVVLSEFVVITCIRGGMEVENRIDNGYVV